MEKELNTGMDFANKLQEPKKDITVMEVKKPSRKRNNVRYEPSNDR